MTETEYFSSQVSTQLHMMTTEDLQFFAFSTEDTTTDGNWNDVTENIGSSENGPQMASQQLMMMLNEVKFVLFPIYGVLILISNLMTIISVIKFKSLRSPPDIMLASLALADLLQVFPSMTFSLIPKIENDTLLRVAAGLSLFSTLASITVSMFDIFLIAIDR